MYECPYTSQSSLPDEAVFYRFIPHMMVTWDGESLTAQSRAFGEIGEETATRLGYPERATSIAFHDNIIAAGKTVEEAADEELGSKCGIAKLTVGAVRLIEPEVGILHDGRHSPWHGILFAVTRVKLGKEKSALVQAIEEYVRLPYRD